MEETRLKYFIDETTSWWRERRKIFFPFFLNRHVKLCHTNAKWYMYYCHQISFRCAQNCEGWCARKNSLTFDTYESNRAIWRSTQRVKTSGGQLQLLLNKSYSGGSFQIQKFRGMGKLLSRSKRQSWCLRSLWSQRRGKNKEMTKDPHMNYIKKFYQTQWNAICLKRWVLRRHTFLSYSFTFQVHVLMYKQWVHGLIF